MLKTLAAKHSCTVSQMATRHRAKIKTPNGIHTCFEARVERNGKQPLVARFGGIPLARKKTAVRPLSYPRKELTIRLLRGRCELCEMLDELTTAGILAGWRPTIYEPEIAAFGGPAAMQTAHDLLCADSRSVLNYARQDAPGLGRRELSLLLINGLMGAAGLDAFERGDVFARVARLRPALDAAHVARAEELAGKVRILLAVPLQPSSTPSVLFAPGGPVAFAMPWLAAFQSAGHWFGEAAAVGRLERGVRAILTQVAIFHWNRVGLSAATQAVLARAARAALLPET